MFQVDFSEERKNLVFDKIAKWWASNLWQNRIINWTLASKLNMIFGDENLVSIFIMLLMVWVIKISDNPINEFSLEFEAKIKEQNIKQVAEALKNLQHYDVRFQWMIYDLYYAHKEEQDKRIVRVRRKKDLHGNKVDILTLKKKIKLVDERIKAILKEQVMRPYDIDEDKLWTILKILRVCFEEEFLIENVDIVNDILRFLELFIERAKVKLRSSFILYWDKWKKHRDIIWNLDFDDYFRTKIEPLVEFELKNPKKFEGILKAFLITNEKDQRISGKWSQKMFEKYWASYLIWEPSKVLFEALQAMENWNEKMEKGYFSFQNKKLWN
jgi:hypothetical protein